MKKILLLFALLFFVFPVKAQETLIVQGQFERSRTGASGNFQRSMFCYFNGNFIMASGHGGIFSVFRVDSVISGSFPNFGEMPFDIPLALINEGVILTDRQNFTLRIRQFPHTNFFYIDSLSQVYPNEQYMEKLAEFHENYQRNIDILTKGTLQERRDFLDKILSNSRLSHRRSYVDFRHISYIIPYMASGDSIINYEIISWRGWNAKGEHVGGMDTNERKGLYSDFLYDFLGQTLPFVLPPKTTDSIGWHKWFESLFSQNDCFQYVEIVQSEHRKIIDGIQSISYFIADTDIHMIHMGVGTSAVRVPWHRLTGQFFVLNINTGELIPKRAPEDCRVARNMGNRRYSIQGDEVIVVDWGVQLATLTDGVFCVEQIAEAITGLPVPKFTGARDVIIHSDNAFLLFYLTFTFDTNAPSNTYLKIGKMDRAGEWIVEPKMFQKSSRQGSLGSSVTNIGTLAVERIAENEILLVFSDAIPKQPNQGSRIRHAATLAVHKIDDNLNRLDSVVFILDSVFPDYFSFLRFSQAHLLKNGNTILLLVENREELFYKLLNDDLIPKTGFIRLSNSKRLTARPIVTSEGFMITWVDNDLTEGLLRSVLIDTSGKQFNIINITNQQIDEVFNVEVDKNIVDIYFHDGRSRSLIRKRINKSEFGLPEIMIDTFPKDFIHAVVEVSPEFPGGMEAKMRFIQSNTRFRHGQGIPQGIIFVSFVVERDGSLTNVRVLRGIDPLPEIGADAQAIRLVESMPNWSPGKIRDEAVRTQFVIPIRFNLGTYFRIENVDTSASPPPAGISEVRRVQVAQRFFPAQVTIIPPVGTHRGQTDQYHYSFSLNILGGVIGGLHGVGINGLAGFVEHNMNGVKISGLLGVVNKGSMKGAQISGLVGSVGGGSVKGAQISGLFSFFNGDMQGIQLTGLVNTSLENIQGTQIAGFGNYSYNISGMQIAGFGNLAIDVKGVQIAGFGNISDIRGTQIAGFGNVSGSMRGIQIAGFGNFAKDVKGMQIAGFGNSVDSAKGVQIAGLFNRSNTLRGLQIGLISVNDTIERGGSLSLVNIVRRGFYREWEISVADYSNVAVTYRMGTRTLYTIYTVGANFIEDNLLNFGIGFGHRRAISSNIDFRPEVVAYNYFSMDFRDIQPTFSARLRLGFIYNISENFGLSLTPSLFVMNGRLNNYRISPIPSFHNLHESENRLTALGIGIGLGINF